MGLDTSNGTALSIYVQGLRKIQRILERKVKSGVNMRKIIDAADFFEPHIFARGKVISHTDAITITHQSADLISAVVEGTDDYDVQIMMQNGDITDMSCSCPYADSGENCKHMAAVLIRCFEYLGDTCEEDEESINLHTEVLTKDQYSAQSEELEKLIRQESYDDIVAFLVSEMLRDSDIKKNFLARFSPKHITVEDMVSDFNSICRFYLGQKRFIDYSHAYDFFAELFGYLDRVNSLIENGSLLQAAQVIAGITKGFDDLPLDDSDGGMTDFYMRIVELLNSILSCEDKETNDFVFNWISQAIADEEAWYLSEMLQPVWESQFNEVELIEKKIEQITAQLRLPISQPEKKAEDYHFISNLIVLAELMLQRGDSVGAVESMLAPFRCSCRILVWLANLAESNGNQEKEYELVQQGLALAQKKHHHGMINEFSVKLCRFYQRTDQIEQYKLTLKNLLLSNPHHLEYYHAYKALFSQEEWSIERSTIIGAFEKQRYQTHTLFEIYKEEKMYNQLLKLIESRGGLNELKEYQKVLVILYPNEVMRLYLANLDTLASQQGSKRHYEQIIFWMKHIRKLTGGHEVIKEKAKEYANLYKRRPSFIRELSRVNW